MITYKKKFLEKGELVPPGFEHNEFPSAAVPFSLLAIAIVFFLIFAVVEEGEDALNLRGQVERGETEVVSYQCFPHGGCGVHTVKK